MGERTRERYSFAFFPLYINSLTSFYYSVSGE